MLFRIYRRRVRDAKLRINQVDCIFDPDWSAGWGSVQVFSPKGFPANLDFTMWEISLTKFEYVAK